MANLRNTRRFLVEDGEPLALGVRRDRRRADPHQPDHRPRLQPGLGRRLPARRGAAQGARRRARARARTRRRRSSARSCPGTSCSGSRTATRSRSTRCQRRGENPYQVERADGSQDPKAFMRSLLREGLGHALRDDISVLRAFMRVFNLLDAPAGPDAPPRDHPARAAGLERAAHRPPLATGPSRDEMLGLLRRGPAPVMLSITRAAIPTGAGHRRHAPCTRERAPRGPARGGRAATPTGPPPPDGPSLRASLASRPVRTSRTGRSSRSRGRAAPTPRRFGRRGGGSARAADR